MSLEFISSIPGHIANKALTSREGARFLESTCSILCDTGTDALSIHGVEVTVKPVQDFIKSVDGACYTCE